MESELSDNLKIIDKSPHHEEIKNQDIDSFREIKKSIQTILSCTSKIEENLKSMLLSQNSKMQNSIDILSDKLEKVNSYFLELKDQQDDLRETIKRSLKIERKLNEERYKYYINEQKEALGQLYKKPDNSRSNEGSINIMGRLGLVNMFLRAVTSNNKRTNKKKAISFDYVERYIRSIYCQGETAKKLINRLKENINLSDDNSSEIILHYFRNIIQKLGTEEKNIIPLFIKKEILSDLDDAEMEYLKKNHIYKPITKSSINTNLEKIEELLQRKPPSYKLKDSIEKFRELLINSNLILDDDFYRDIRITENELLTKTNTRIEGINAHVYASKLKSWREKINSIIPGSTSVPGLLDPILQYLNRIVSRLSNNDKDIDKDIENDAYKLLILLNKGEKSLRKHINKEEFINQIQNLKNELEKDIYSKINLNDAMRYFEIISSWKRELNIIKNEV